MCHANKPDTQGTSIQKIQEWPDYVEIYKSLLIRNNLPLLHKYCRNFRIILPPVTYNVSILIT